VGNFWGKITYYENIGSNVEPNFKFITKDYAGVDLGGATYAGRTCPEFCDLDGDGDYDLFTSDFRGLIHYWENIGTIFEPEFQFVTDSFEYIDVTGRAKLALCDIDCDGDFDLFLGDYYGHIA
jgi:hypothetical protein